MLMSWKYGSETKWDQNHNTSSNTSRNRETYEQVTGPHTQKMKKVIQHNPGWATMKIAELILKENTGERNGKL